VEVKSHPILVYEPQAATRARWVRLLLAAGFAPVLAETREQLVQNIASGRYPVVMVFLDHTDTTLLQAVRLFRERVEFRFIQFEIVLDTTEQNTVLELIKAGFYHIITRSQSDQVFLEKLTALTSHLNTSGDRRQHVRVQVMEYENAKLIINLTNARKITSIIKNISVGGIQVAFRERIFVRFYPNEVLTNCLLVFKNLDLTTDVKVISTFDKGLQLQFHGLDEPRYNQIAALVQERIQFDYQ